MANICPVNFGSELPRVGKLPSNEADDGGAGFCRFPAWAKVKSNDVSLGHAVALFLRYVVLTPCASTGLPMS